MKSAILMTSVAVAALAGPAFAGPDRYEQGSGCTGMSGAACVQEEMRLEDGNRASEKQSNGAIDNGAAASSGGIGANAADDDDFGDEVGNEANEVGDAIGDTANEAGDEIGDAADEAGDAIGDAFD